MVITWGGVTIGRSFRNTTSAQRAGEDFTITAADMRPPVTSTPERLLTTTVLVVWYHMMDSCDNYHCHFHTGKGWAEGPTMVKARLHKGSMSGFGTSEGVIPSLRPALVTSLGALLQDG